MRRTAAALVVACLALASLVLVGCDDPESSSPPATATAEAAAYNEPLMGGEPLSFDSAGVPIAAELLLPQGDGPFPGILFISGSGPTRRDGVSPPLDLRTDELLIGLRDAGYAVLSFDDRASGWTPLGGLNPIEMGYELLLNDARAALTTLREREEVDAERIYLMGHSEGGQTVIVMGSELGAGTEAIPSLAESSRSRRRPVPSTRS